MVFAKAANNTFLNSHGFIRSIKSGSPTISSETNLALKHNILNLNISLNLSIVQQIFKDVVNDTDHTALFHANSVGSSYILAICNGSPQGLISI